MAICKAANARVLLQWDLRQALENQEILLHYQPVVALDSLETIAMEALVRWNHPDKGLLFPEKFIALAEKSDIIIHLGTWVLRTALKQGKYWRDCYGYKGSINVNVSAHQVIQSGFRSVLIDILNESGFPPESLTLEITESLMLDPTEDLIRKFEDLKKIGVKIAIDDFGTGYSSLSYLWQYPIDYLKIDKSFIFNISTNKKKQHIVEIIIKMCQNMGLKVVAEGVETGAVLIYLQQFSCEAAQGYYFRKPIPPEDYEEVLKK